MWRLERLNLIAAQLAAKDPLEQASGLQKFWVFVSGEFRLMRSRAVWNDRVAVAAGRKKNAYWVRLGLVHVSYVTEDGREIGVSVPGVDDDWITDLSTEDRQAILSVLGVLQRREAPRLIDVPFPRSSTRAAAESSVGPTSGLSRSAKGNR